MFWILRKTRQSRFKGKIYGFDIETYDRNRKFYCASVYYDDDHKWTFYDKQKLIDFFKTKRFKNSIVSATNLGFDFFGTFFSKKEAMEFNTLFRGSDLIFARTYIKNEKFQKHSRGTHGSRMVFIDTFNYAHMSVEKLGKVLGIEKIEKPSFIGRLPQNDKEIKEMELYNMRDSEISKRYIEFLYRSFESLGATPKLTIASTAMSLFKNKFLGDDEYHLLKDSELLEIFEAYYGGRTEAFKRGRIQDYEYYDFNSLYPSVMKDFHYPDPNSKQTTYKNTLEYIKQYEGVSKVDIECPYMKYPLLPYRFNNKLVFPTGRFTGWYSHVELRRAIELGYKILNVHKTYYFKNNCHPFIDYVDYCYGKRMEFKEQKNPMEQVVKLLMNGLYGKFGQKFVDRDNWIPFNLTKEELDKLEWFERVGDYMRIKQSRTRPSSFCIPIWALYVTAYARIKLHHSILETEPVYVDTDSLVTKKQVGTSKELGDLKKELHVIDGIICKPKMYALISDQGDYVKIKGVAKKLTFKEFKEFLKNPTVHYQRFLKFKESLRRGFIPNEIYDMTKNLDVEDNKRVWKGVFTKEELQDSEPIHIVTC